MFVYVITKTEHFPYKETFEFLSSNKESELAVTGTIRKWNTYIIGITTRDQEAKLMLETEKQNLVAKYGKKVLEESPNPRHRFFTFGVELREVME